MASPGNAASCKSVSRVVLPGRCSFAYAAALLEVWLFPGQIYYGVVMVYSGQKFLQYIFGTDF